MITCCLKWLPFTSSSCLLSEMAICCLKWLPTVSCVLHQLATCCIKWLPAVSSGYLLSQVATISLKQLPAVSSSCCLSSSAHEQNQPYKICHSFYLGMKGKRAVALSQKTAGKDLPWRQDGVEYFICLLCSFCIQRRSFSLARRLRNRPSDSWRSGTCLEGLRLKINIFLASSSSATWRETWFCFSTNSCSLASW